MRAFRCRSAAGRFLQLSYPAEQILPSPAAESTSPRPVCAAYPGVSKIFREDHQYDRDVGECLPFSMKSCRLCDHVVEAIRQNPSFPSCEHRWSHANESDGPRSTKTRACDHPALPAPGATGDRRDGDRVPLRRSADPGRVRPLSHRGLPVGGAALLRGRPAPRGIVHRRVPGPGQRRQLPDCLFGRGFPSGFFWSTASLGCAAPPVPPAGGISSGLSHPSRFSGPERISASRSTPSLMNLA
jgi:hypothetical protein